jgi:hypothetical protein
MCGPALSAAAADPRAAALSSPGEEAFPNQPSPEHSTAGSFLHFMVQRQMLQVVLHLDDFKRLPVGFQKFPFMFHHTLLALRHS